MKPIRNMHVISATTYLFAAYVWTKENKLCLYETYFASFIIRNMLAKIS